jgi:hypothetical protein
MEITLSAFVMVGAGLYASHVILRKEPVKDLKILRCAQNDGTALLIVE